ncbi:PilC/PilY family type IV pilus protein [Hahella sp. CR1]|uniref:PilC/PilY family type IV pilus protein n=1 Tax=Hahella sp. CR1 TaxID=2992807 RepID=UPI002441A561|nr:PilC/PilY family type IV pilus protein [Hahella sp. CR1]MDG9670393.1 PilC/PilY family type IV pilus protein [Hahella sp. CR1]
MCNKYLNRLLYSALGFLLVAPSASFATKLGLPDNPLVVSSRLNPNLMMLLDSSGSMQNVVMDAPFDAASFSYNCTRGHRIGDEYYIDVIIDRSNGEAGIYISGNRYTFGTGSGEYCFDNSKTYSAELYADYSNSNWYWASGTYGYGRYSGQYLNWYFSDGSGNPDRFRVGSNVQRKKPSAKRRVEVMQEAAKALVNSMEDIRVGLAKFDGSAGASILTNIGDIKSNKSNLISGIDSISAGGSTPLAEAFQELGRYFSYGTKNTNITIHPGVTGKEKEVALTSVFPDQPSFASGLKAPSNVVQGWCQSNYIMALTDGQPTNDYNDVSSYLRDYDGDCTPANGCNGSGTGSSDRDKKSTTGYTYDPNGSDYMDDVILALYDIDFRTDLSEDASVKEKQTKNNIRTFLIGFAETGLAGDQLMADAAKASNNGTPYNALNSSELAEDFEDIIKTVKSEEAAVGSVAFNSSQLSSDSAVFQAKFTTGTWTGLLQAYPLNGDGSFETETDADGNVSLKVAWEAGALLNSTTASARNIFSFNGNAGVRDGVAFKTFADLSDTMKADLYMGVDIDGDGNSTNDADDAQSLLNYIRGDDANKGAATNKYRSRSGKLGDLVNSTPVYVGVPQMDWPDNTGVANTKFGTVDKKYSSFKSSTKRDEVLYVGANDGMLHGFNASLTNTNKGKEVFAYIPEAIASTSGTAGLHYLASQDYVHKFYVDLTPAVNDIFIDSTSPVSSASRDWRTVLIGGLRAGGRGYFALDVTDPSKYSNANNASDIVLWEFTNKDDADLGYTYSTPTIAMMQNGKWAAIFGNGYNSDAEKAKLFIVFIEEGVDGTWSAGDYVKIETDNTLDSNGLSTPRAVDVDGDKVVDRIYAGDLRGNMWVFDVTDASEKNWKLAYSDPLFTAKNAANEEQAITSAPLLSVNRNVTTVDANRPNALVLFGTGQFLQPSDLNSTREQSFYAVWDSGKSKISRSNLKSRTLTTAGNQREITGADVNYSGATPDYGWYMDLKDSSSASPIGERVVSEPLLRRQVLFFNSIIPSSTDCSFGGTGWLMSIDYDSGKAPTFPVYDANGDGKIDSSDLGKVGERYVEGLPSKSGILGDIQYTPGTKGVIEDRKVDLGAGPKEGRLFWEQYFRD